MRDLPKKRPTRKPRPGDDFTPTVLGATRRMNRVRYMIGLLSWACGRVKTTCAAEYNRGRRCRNRKAGCPTIKIKRKQKFRRRYPTRRSALKRNNPPYIVCTSLGIPQLGERCPVHDDRLRDCCTRCHPWLPGKLRQLLTQLGESGGPEDTGIKIHRAKQQKLLRVVIEKMEAEIRQHTSHNSTQHGPQVSIGLNDQSQTNNTSENSGVTVGNPPEPAETGSTPMDEDLSSADQSLEQWQPSR